LREEEPEIHQRGGEYVVEAEASWRHLSDPLLHQPLAEAIEEECQQRGCQPHVHRDRSHSTLWQRQTSAAQLSLPFCRISRRRQICEQRPSSCNPLSLMTS